MLSSVMESVLSVLLPTYAIRAIIVTVLDCIVEINAKKFILSTAVSTDEVLVATFICIMLAVSFYSGD
jgi:hypothetical protein